MRTSRSRAAAVLFLALSSVLLAVPASAALIDLVVVGIWESANVSPVINKFGFVDGDRFVMKATYNDATLFDGSEGVTATIDPGQVAGTSFQVIIPHAAGAPNPLLFDHSDHTDIGFAPYAQIEFTGTHPGMDPGVFRNFEIHVDFSFAGDLHDLDLYKGAIQEVAELYNESQGFNLAATGTGPEHLLVVVNDITANAGGPYVFDASNLALNTNGSSGGGSGFTKVFDWTESGGALANSPGAAISFGLAESGLVDVADTSSIDLQVTELFTDFVSSMDAAAVSYSNATPAVLSASGSTQPDLSIDFSATVDDDDLIANALVLGFESVTLGFLHNSNLFLTGNGNIDVQSLLFIFGGIGVHSVEARATDQAGATHSLFFNIDLIECDDDGDCEDGAFCTGNETCIAKQCISDGDPCAATSLPYCDESSDQCFECEFDVDCDDGDFCTGTETCDSGSCNSSGDPCPMVAPICDEAGDVCVECVVDGDCAGGEVCSSGVCEGGPLPIPATSLELRMLLVAALLSLGFLWPWINRRRA
jgi:hypothetical protein